jgi:two-component system NtrC family response regulator
MKTLPTLLLVDDDPEIRDQMKWALASDYELLEASDRPSALNVVRQAMAQIILLDLGLPTDTDGASEGLAVLSETLHSIRWPRAIAIDRKPSLPSKAAHTILLKSRFSSTS